MLFEVAEVGSLRTCTPRRHLALGLRVWGLGLRVWYAVSREAGLIVRPEPDRGEYSYFFLSGMCDLICIENYYTPGGSSCISKQCYSTLRCKSDRRSPKNCLVGTKSPYTQKDCFWETTITTQLDNTSIKKHFGGISFVYQSSKSILLSRLTWRDEARERQQIV